VPYGAFRLQTVSRRNTLLWGQSLIYCGITVAANSARDIGARLMALTIWGKQAAGGSYAAIAALTNILATILAVRPPSSPSSQTRRKPGRLRQWEGADGAPRERQLGS
jgi:hypothetical protein